jgi:glucosyl-dolichyl phosphate glucuronosyltransferase
MVPSAISILVCTYNRAESLDETLSAVAHLSVPSGWRAELVLVDNNSTDCTQEVIGRHRAEFPFPLIAAFERRQGKGFALNRGLRVASGDIVALTDDDVVPAADWLERIVEAFDGRDVSFVCGKVLPHWEQQPPADLLTAEAQEIWGPLALVDYGDAPVDYAPDTFGKRRLPVGANLAFKRQALVRIGGWRNDLGKVDDSLISGEDHEIFHRMLRAGLFSGRYDPAIVVRHHVPASRLSPGYFRRWFFWSGRTIARMLPDYYREIDFAAAPRVAGAPRFLYRQAVEQWLSWAASLAGRRRPGPWVQQLRAIRDLGILVECWAQRRRRLSGAPGHAAERVPGDALVRRGITTDVNSVAGRTGVKE